MNVPNVFATQPVAEPVIAAIAIADAVPAAEPVQHSNLIGIVTRTSWVSRRKGLVQQALDRLAGKAVLDRDGKRTIEFQVITAEDRLDVSKLDNTHSQMLAGIGEYIRVNVDLAAPGGQEYAHDLIQRPQIFSEDVKGVDGVTRKRVHFNGRPMHFAGWYFQKAFFVALMVPEPRKNVFDMSGTEVAIASKKEALAACKRIRRDFAHNAMFFEGRLTGEPVLSRMPYVSRDGVAGFVPATMLPVEFPAKSGEFGEAVRGWIRILHLDKHAAQAVRWPAAGGPVSDERADSVLVSRDGTAAGRLRLQRHRRVSAAGPSRAIRTACAWAASSTIRLCCSSIRRRSFA